MDKITELKSQPDKEVVEFLEEELRLAKRGDIQTLAIVTVNRSGVVFKGFCGYINPVGVIGGLEMLKIEFMASRMSDV